MKLRKITIVLALVAGFLFYLSACDMPTTTTQQNYDLFKGLETVEGAEEVKITINQGSAVGRDAYFEFEVENIDSELLAPGIYDGWCIDWTKHIAQQGAVHENLEMYSTFGKEEWKPLNYLLNIKDELQAEDPELNFADFQAIIWSVQEGPDFDINQLSNNELPPRLLKDGKPIFSLEKVNAIVEQIRAKAAAFEYTSETKYALFFKTGEDEQDVMVPADPPEDDGDDENQEEVIIEILDLGNIDSNTLKEARAINNQGQITGFSNSTRQRTEGHIFIWEEGTGMVPLERHPDANPSETAYGYGINNSGVIVGQQWPLAVKWSDTNGIQALADGVAYSINNNGVVVGARRISGNQYEALMWDNNGTEQKLEINNHGVAWDINDNDRVVGVSGTEAVIWENGDIVRNIGTLGGPSVAKAINNQGQIAGYSSLTADGNNRRAFYWDETSGMINIGTIDDYESVATDINNHGQVVGYVEIPAIPQESSSESRAFYWDKDRGMILLEPLEANYSFSYAYGINDNGEIVGFSSSDETGHTKAVRWTITFE